MGNSARIPALPGSAGDLIVFHRGLYKHYAVNVGNGEIVHVTSSDLTIDACKGKECSTFYKAVIKKEKFEDFVKAGDEVSVETRGEKPFSPEEIVRRANSSLGPMNYNLFWGNCEHFVRWCCYGE
ncbi:lecithin retinol acyltransferase-like [Stylophora pistillata]|uniref:lecithin retinol acyltransferase-like n=1 Tax=Stylophora pistillata TaxID=50429 RepID=UPI000C055A04|nr:lecithin retinol acyltransferase-like [Stylophora pistillata]